jgi:hypothetical protein
MPITKIHFVRKARDRLWITGKVRRKNALPDKARRIAANIAKLPELMG